MKTIQCELRKELTTIENFEIKPNFAFLARKYGLDYRTIKKYYEGYNGKPVNREKGSKLDIYHDLIKEKMSYSNCKISSLYFFLKNEKNYKGSYSNLTYYIRHSDDIKQEKKSNNVNVRYETSMGEQIQFDWVEDITMINKYGKSFTFNIFSSCLSYSRFQYFIYSEHKTREDVISCLIQSLLYFGGITESTLTDNMSSIVNHNTNDFVSEFKAFAKDFGIDIKKCKVRHPETKGKVEVKNKFIKWLIPYNNEFETEEDLINILKKLTIEVNNRVNSTTKVKPILLYQKEKEYLNPLPSNQIIQHYMNLSTSVSVKNTSLIYYKGSEYSVPPKFINKTLKVKEIDNKLYIYDNTNLITIHEISNKKINYKKDHYIEGLSKKMPDKDENFIEELAKKNLDLFDEISNVEKELLKNENK